MSDEEKSVEALRAELELHKAELKKLKDQINPPKSEPFVMPRFDPTEGMSMPRNAMQAMIDAVPESLMKELRADARKPNPVTQASSSPLSTKPSVQSQPQRGSGWIDPRPLESPPGLKYVDAQIDAQDAKDRAELAHKLAQVELSKRRGRKEKRNETKSQ